MEQRDYETLVLNYTQVLVTQEMLYARLLMHQAVQILHSARMYDEVRSWWVPDPEDDVSLRRMAAGILLGMPISEILSYAVGGPGPDLDAVAVLLGLQAGAPAERF